MSQPTAFGPASTPPPPPAYPTAFSSHPDPAPAGVRRSRLGMAALFLGLLSISLGWLPVIGLVVMVPALIGLALALMGFIGATFARAAGGPRVGRKLPAAAGAVCLFGVTLPPVATLLAVVLAGPYVWQVGVDRAQIEWRQELVRNDVDADAADRISTAITDAFRPLGDLSRRDELPAAWRSALQTVGRFEEARKDYARAVRLGLVEQGEAVAAEVAAAEKRFDRDVRAIADAAGVGLSESDVSALIGFLKEEVAREVRRWAPRHVESFRSGAAHPHGRIELITGGACSVPAPTRGGCAGYAY